MAGRIARTNDERLLVVDDDATITGVLSDLLRREGFAVDVAHDGESAPTVVAREEPALVVLDVMLPGQGCRSHGPVVVDG